MEEAVLKDLYNKAGKRESITITIPASCAINARSALQHLTSGPNLIDAAGFRAALDEFDIGVERGIDLKSYLDTCIQAWREKFKTAANLQFQLMAQGYIDAFQSVRLTIFDEILPED